MKYRIYKLLLFLGLLLAPVSLLAQGTVSEMVDKAKNLMIDNHYSEAYALFKNAVTLDPKIESSVLHYMKKCVNAMNRPKVETVAAPKFTLSNKLIDFKGIDQEQTVSVTLESGDWSAEALEDWCNVSVDKTFKEATLACTKNFTGKSRKCLVLFSHNDGKDNITDIYAVVRQKSEDEILKVKDSYLWRDPQRPDYLMLESTGDLVFVNLDCNTEWTVLHKPEEVEVSNDSGDMSKLVIRIAPIEGGEKYVKFAKKLIGTLVKDYITIATVNQDVRLTIQVEKYKLGKTQEEKDAEQAKKTEKKEQKKAAKSAKETESAVGNTEEIETN